MTRWKVGKLGDLFMHKIKLVIVARSVDAHGSIPVGVNLLNMGASSVVLDITESENIHY